MIHGRNPQASPKLCTLNPELKAKEPESAEVFAEKEDRRRRVGLGGKGPQGLIRVDGEKQSPKRLVVCPLKTIEGLGVEGLGLYARALRSLEASFFVEVWGGSLITVAAFAVSFCPKNPTSRAHKPHTTHPEPASPSPHPCGLAYDNACHCVSDL